MKILIAEAGNRITDQQKAEARVVVINGKVVKDNLGCTESNGSGTITLQLPPYIEANLPETVMSDLTDTVADAIEAAMDDDAINIPLTELMARVSNELQARQS